MPAGQRKARESERIRAAASAARATGSAMDAALAQIGAAFGEAAAVFDLKQRVERAFCLGPQHPAMRARYGARAERLRGFGLDGASAAVDRWWRDERKAFQIASALGYGRRLPLEVLRELRLILRLMRYKRLHGEFGAIAAAVCHAALPLAAE
jgi:hypothetical protein